MRSTTVDRSWAFPTGRPVHKFFYLVPRDTKVQLVGPDVAVILFHAKYLQNGKEVPVLDRTMILVAVRETDGWKIAAGQLRKQHEGA